MNKMQHDNLIWLVPVIAGAIALYLLVEIGRFYVSIRATPWQVYKDKRRKVAAMLEDRNRIKEAYLAERYGSTSGYIIPPSDLDAAWAQLNENAYTGWQERVRMFLTDDTGRKIYDTDRFSDARIAEVKAEDQRRLKVQIWVLIVLGIVALVIALASCGVISGANQHPYGKSYDQNNPTCTNRRP